MRQLGIAAKACAACLVAGLAAGLAVFGAAAPAAAPPNETAVPPAVAAIRGEDVLVLSGVQYGLPLSDTLIAALVDRLRQRGISVNDLYVEALDLARSREPEFKSRVVDLLRTKLRSANLGVVIVVGQQALAFLANEGRKLLPASVPVLTLLVPNPRVAWSGAPPPVISFPDRVDAAGTLHDALALFPGTRRVVVVAGVDDAQSPFLAPTAQALAALPGEVEIEYTSALRYEEMLKRIASLPPHSVILYGPYFADGSGRNFVPGEVAAVVGRAANAPVFAFYDAHIATGLAGGSVTRATTLGNEAGDVTWDLLHASERPAPGVSERSVASEQVIDWLQVERWKGQTAKIPESAVVRHRPASLWNQFRREVVLATATLAVLVLLLAALVLENRRRRVVADKLRQSEQQLVNLNASLETRIAARTAELEASEASLRALTASLEAQVAERTAQLTAAAAAKSEFLARMSHEIRTPMNGVIGVTQLLKYEPLTADQHALVLTAEESGQALLRIINDILDFSKLEAGQLHIEQDPFEPGAVLARVDHLLRPAAQQKGIAFSIVPPLGGLHPVVGDALRLEQVLVNLINNAIKFTDRGNVTLTVDVPEETADGVRLRFEVRDTGIGIAPEALATLFQPFTQADSGITRRFGGTGLGLVICKQLVEMMGGRIGASSTPGEGSTFWFELPLPWDRKPPPMVTKAAARAPAEGPQLAGMRVLAADDNRINLVIVEKSLRAAGATVALAADGQQALQVLTADPQAFDVVLMDIQMPVMDGLTATRAIRADPNLAAIPVVALTAGVLPEERARALAAGVDDFLPKPLDTKQMIAMLAALRAGRPRAGWTEDAGSGH